MITEMPEIIFEAVEPLVVVEIPTEFGVEETEGKFFVFSIINMRVETTREIYFFCYSFLEFLSTTDVVEYPKEQNLIVVEHEQIGQNWQQPY